MTTESDIVFVPLAVHVVKHYSPFPLTEGSGTYGTLRAGVPQHAADDISVVDAPVIVAHSAPLAIVVDLYATLGWITSSYQPHLQ